MIYLSQQFEKLTRFCPVKALRADLKRLSKNWEANSFWAEESSSVFPLNVAYFKELSFEINAENFFSSFKKKICIILLILCAFFPVFNSDTYLWCWYIDIHIYYYLINSLFKYFLLIKWCPAQTESGPQDIHILHLTPWASYHLKFESRLSSFQPQDNL